MEKQFMKLLKDCYDTGVKTRNRYTEGPLSFETFVCKNSKIIDEIKILCSNASAGN